MHQSTLVSNCSIPDFGRWFSLIQALTVLRSLLQFTRVQNSLSKIERWHSPESPGYQLPFNYRQKTIIRKHDKSLLNLGWKVITYQLPSSKRVSRPIARIGFQDWRWCVYSGFWETEQYWTRGAESWRFFKKNHALDWERTKILKSVCTNVLFVLDSKKTQVLNVFPIQISSSYRTQVDPRGKLLLMRVSHQRLLKEHSTITASSLDHIIPIRWFPKSSCRRCYVGQYTNYQRGSSRVPSWTLALLTVY